MEETKETKSDLDILCEDLNNLNNLLISCKLTPKEIKIYIRSEMREQAKKIRRDYYKEFKDISINNLLKQEVQILLEKLGILRTIRVPTIKQLENNEELKYSSDELTETEDDEVEEKFYEGDHKSESSSSEIGSGNDSEDLNKSIVKLNMSEDPHSGVDSVDDETQVDFVDEDEKK